jgi:hypothetical protein
LIIYGIFKEQCSCLQALRKCHPAATVEEKSNTFQKIFPVKDLPIAFVHHGFNIFGDNPIGRFIEGYTSAYATTLLSLNVKLIFYSCKNNIVLLRVDRGALNVLGTTDGSLADL